MVTIRSNPSLRYPPLAIVLWMLVASLAVSAQTPRATPESKATSQPAQATSSANVSNPDNSQGCTPPEKNTSKAEGKSLSWVTKEDLGILSDTAGVDFGPFITQLRAVVQKHWEPLIPESALPPVMKSGQVIFEFAIMKSGYVQDLRLEKSSGDVVLDRAAKGAITTSVPFSSFPAAFPGESVRLRVSFFYNPRRW